MIDANGTGPLAGWVIVQCHGLTLIGRAPSPNSLLRLSPVFELKPQMQMTREGTQIAHLVVPVWLLGMRDFEVPAGAIVEPCENLSPRQRESLWRGVQAAESIAAAMRAEDAGVVLAPPGAKLPPMRGRT